MWRVQNFRQVGVLACCKFCFISTGQIKGQINCSMFNEVSWFVWVFFRGFGWFCVVLFDGSIAKFYTVVKSPQKQALAVVKSGVTLSKRAIQSLIEMRLNPQITHRGLRESPDPKQKCRLAAMWIWELNFLCNENLCWGCISDITLFA